MKRAGAGGIDATQVFGAAPARPGLFDNSLQLGSPPVDRGMIVMRIQSGIEAVRRAVRFGAMVPSLAAAFALPDSRGAHWSCLPLSNSAIPAVGNASSTRTPEDRFILARLEEQRLKPSLQSDPRRLVQ